MKYFIPTEKDAEIRCYGGEMCSAKKPVGLTGLSAEKASANPMFTEVVKKKVAKKKATRKKVAKK
ncbi:MAG: hypothetical protein KJO91_08320 [Gammaproteobacteria bacterium]|nr:hypothetical protein [Gammaproteobacteria bacterium]